MAKLAVILPHENLRDTMRMLLRMMRMDQAVILQYSGDYNEIPALVSQAKHQGIDIILTRGLVAERVRQCSDLPVVDIRVTAQETHQNIHHFLFGCTVQLLCQICKFGADIIYHIFDLSQTLTGSGHSVTDTFHDNSDIFHRIAQGIYQIGHLIQRI